MENIPQHIAIIMDGNGRWARKRGLPRVLGHREGVNSVKEVVRTCGEMGIKYLTLFVFSEENWQRPKREIEQLMSLLEEVIKKKG
jgi:undecaprenyl diphosphate synthase